MVTQRYCHPLRPREINMENCYFNKERLLSIIQKIVILVPYGQIKFGNYQYCKIHFL